VQEVFIRVYRHIGRFDRSKKFSTWIYTIASNLAKNELRNRSRNPLVLFQSIKKTSQEDDRPLQFEDSSSRPDDLYRKRHLRELVEESVAKLPAHHREVFVLRELEGKSYEEIAEITQDQPRHRSSRASTAPRRASPTSSSRSCAERGAAPSVATRAPPPAPARAPSRGPPVSRFPAAYAGTRHRHPRAAGGPPRDGGYAVR
jgi:RNA polymerase sigma factor (sigma-70 family)